MVDSSNKGVREVHEMSQRGSSGASLSGDKFHYKAFPSLRDTHSFLLRVVALSHYTSIQGRETTHLFIRIESVRELPRWAALTRSEEHTSELQSRGHLVCCL